MTHKNWCFLMLTAATASLTPWHALGQASDEGVIGDSTCIEKVAKNSTSKDPLGSHDFNVKFDRNVDGDSFSCHQFTTATRALHALDAFRFGFLYESEEHLARSVDFPIPASKHQTRALDDNGVTTILKTPRDLIEYKKQFNALQIAMIACASPSTVYMAGWRGFFIGVPNLVWFTGIYKVGFRVTSIHLAPTKTDWLLESCIPVQEREHLIHTRGRQERIEEYLRELDAQKPEAKPDPQPR